MKDESYQEFIRPWISGGLVAKMGTGMPPGKLRDYTYKQYLEDIENTTPGKYSPILYSLSSAFQLHGIQQAVSSGYSIKNAIKIGKKVKEYGRFLIREGKINLILENISDDIVEDILIFQISISDKDIESYVTQSDKLIKLSINTGEIIPKTSTGAYGLIKGAFHIGFLVQAILLNYFELDEKINKLALDGKLKPLPEFNKL